MFSKVQKGLVQYEAQFVHPFQIRSSSSARKWLLRSFPHFTNQSFCEQYMYISRYADHREFSLCLSERGINARWEKLGVKIQWKFTVEFYNEATSKSPTTKWSWLQGGS